jgi:hypothetical protein
MAEPTTLPFLKDNIPNLRWAMIVIIAHGAILATIILKFNGHPLLIIVFITSLYWFLGGIVYAYTYLK